MRRRTAPARTTTSTSGSRVSGVKVAQDGTAKVKELSPLGGLRPGGGGEEEPNHRRAQGRQGRHPRCRQEGRQAPLDGGGERAHRPGGRIPGQAARALVRVLPGRGLPHRLLAGEGVRGRGRGEAERTGLERGARRRRAYQEADRGARPAEENHRQDAARHTRAGRGGALLSHARRVLALTLPGRQGPHRVRPRRGQVPPTRALQSSRRTRRPSSSGRTWPRPTSSPRTARPSSSIPPPRCA